MALPILTIFQDATVGLISLMFKPYLPFDLAGVNSMVRIAVALNDKENGPTQADGRAPSLVAFNEKEWYIGASEWVANDHVKSGSYVDVVVHQEDDGAGQEPAYMQVLGHDDAVCVAYIGQTWPDGQQRGWLGDVGRACGKRWFFSNVEVGEQKYMPDCTWLDRDHAKDGTDALENIEAAAMQIHMQDFTNLTGPYPTDPSYYCTYPATLFVRDYDYEFRLEWFEHKIPSRSRIAFWKDHGFRSKRRSPHPHRRRPRPSRRSPALRSKLVSSTHEKHSAKALCGSDTSHGPDFVSHSEGLFCDMGTKRVWPLCKTTEEVEVGCYDWESHGLVTREGKEGRDYADVEEWA